METSNKFQWAFIGFLAGCTAALGPLTMINLYVLPCEPPAQPGQCSMVQPSAAGNPGSRLLAVSSSKWGGSTSAPARTACPPCLFTFSSLCPPPARPPASAPADWIFVMWLDVVTYLHHHGPSDKEEEVPWYRGGEWSYFRGGLSTIDRDYGIFNKLHHDIGTHVVHHLFPQVGGWVGGCGGGWVGAGVGGWVRGWAGARAGRAGGARLAQGGMQSAAPRAPLPPLLASSLHINRPPNQPPPSPPPAPRCPAPPCPARPADPPLQPAEGHRGCQAGDGPLLPRARALPRPHPHPPVGAPQALL